jgi:hypothetical protein
MPNKLIRFYPDRLQALKVLGADKRMTLQELADEAFADLLKKHGRPVGLLDSLRSSAGEKQPRPRPRNRGR